MSSQPAPILAKVVKPGNTDKLKAVHFAGKDGGAAFRKQVTATRAVAMSSQPPPILEKDVKPGKQGVKRKIEDEGSTPSTTIVPTTLQCKPAQLLAAHMVEM